MIMSVSNFQETLKSSLIEILQENVKVLYNLETWL